MVKSLYKKTIWLVIMSIVVFLLTLLHIFSFYSHKTLETRGCAVVFGAAVWPTHFGPVASHALSDRTLTAASLYKSGLVDCIVLSGADSIYGAHEVDIMTDLLIDADIPENIIELDRIGLDTRATIEHLDKSRSYVLISNDFHLARIGLFAQRRGLNDTGFSLHSASYISGGRYTKEPYFVFRDAVAFWYYFFTAFAI